MAVSAAVGVKMLDDTDDHEEITERCRGAGCR
jgi:hypothetical protein